MLVKNEFAPNDGRGESDKSGAILMIRDCHSRRRQPQISGAQDGNVEFASLLAQLQKSFVLRNETLGTCMVGEGKERLIVTIATARESVWQQKGLAAEAIGHLRPGREALIAIEDFPLFRYFETALRIGKDALQFV